MSNSQEDLPPVAPFAPLPILTGASLPNLAVGWAAAPAIVNRAYRLSILGLVVFSLVTLSYLFNGVSSKNGEFFAASFFFALVTAANIYLIVHIKKGTPLVWILQLVLSCLGLVGFPWMTFIHVRLLSQWFQPETKAWFGR